jgi:hypothetical protein
MSILGGDLSIASGGGLSVGPGTLGSNVVIFSNVSGGSNVFGMDSNASVVIGLVPSSNVNYGAGYPNTSKAALIVQGANDPNYPITLSLLGRNSGIDFGGGGQACAQIRNSYIGGGSGSISFWLNNGNGADGSIFEKVRITNNGLFGVGTSTPSATIHAIGNIYSSNALSTTNVFATGNVVATRFMSAGGFTVVTGGPTLGVTGNIYASNALTTTNLFTAGFTSNASNTIFNFDTLTIPFISATTLNVASTSNLVGAITSSQSALVGFLNIITRRPIVTAATNATPTATADSGSVIPVNTTLIIKPFSDVAAGTGATRKYRLYAVWADNSAAGATTFTLKVTDGTTSVSFTFTYTSLNNSSSFISGFSDVQVISGSAITMNATSAVVAGGTARTISFNYIEIQALDQY